MKYIITLVIISFFAVNTQRVSAQKASKTATITIKTSAQCEMCKERIEKVLAYEKGVISSNLEVETKVLTVKYKVAKTTPEKIKIAITKIGYDADDLKAAHKAHDNLPQCCQKGGHEH